MLDKKMKLGLHTYTLHLWGLGAIWGIISDPSPKEINLMQLMDMAANGVWMGCTLRDAIWKAKMISV